jgi:two-component system sensor histidine kinase UhpB
MKTSIWRNWGISARLVSMIIAPVAILFCTNAIYTYFSRNAEVLTDMAERGHVIATALADNSEYGVISGNLAELQRTIKGVVQADKTIYAVDVLGADKRTLLHVQSGLPLNTANSVFEAPVRRQLLSMNEFEEDGLPHVSGNETIGRAPAPSVVGYVRVTMSPSELAAKQTTRVYVQSVMTLLASIASVMCALYLARQLHRPMAATINALREIRQGNYDVRVDVDTGGELGDLLSSVNDMSSSLKEATQNLENKVLDRTRDLEASRNEAVRSDAEKRKLIQKVDSAVEDERKSIALEIHDELNAALLAARLNSQRIIDLTADSAFGPGAAEVREKAESTIKITASLYASARNVVRRLRPEVLDMLGLDGAVDEMLQNYDTSHPNCRFTFNSSGDFAKLEGNLGIAAYRLIQEALSNVVKHAQATQVNVSLIVDDDENVLHITITDNGVGFDPNALNSGIGLIGMRERVFAFHGEVEFMTEPDIGTAVAIRIPLVEVMST